MIYDECSREKGKNCKEMREQRESKRRRGHARRKLLVEKDENKKVIEKQNRKGDGREIGVVIIRMWSKIE